MNMTSKSSIKHVSLCAVALIAMWSVIEHRGCFSDIFEIDQDSPKLKIVRKQIKNAKDIDESDWLSAQTLLIDMHNEQAFRIIESLIDLDKPYHEPFEFVLTNSLKPYHSCRSLRAQVRSEIAMLAASGEKSWFQENTNYFSRWTKRVADQNKSFYDFMYGNRHADRHFTTECHFPEGIEYVQVGEKRLTAPDAAIYSEITNFNAAFIATEMGRCVFGRRIKPITNWNFTNEVLNSIYF